MSNLSFVRHKGDGVTNQFALSVAGENIGYFRISDIHGYVDDKEVPITIDPNSPHIVRFTETPKLNSDILIRRQMPVKKTYADFERGNNFGHRQVNNTFVQQLYLTQELLDGFFPSGFYFKQDVDLGGHKITNLGDATEDSDAVNKKVTDSLNTRLKYLENSVSGSSRFLTWTYNAVGGEDTLNPPYKFESARVFINGVRQRAGESFEIVDLTIMLAEPLEEGDWVDVELGTEPRDCTETEVAVRNLESGVSNLNTTRDAIIWRAGLHVYDSSQLYVHDGVEYLPNPKVIPFPFTTGATFNPDNWLLSKIVTTINKFKLDGYTPQYASVGTIVAPETDLLIINNHGYPLERVNTQASVMGIKEINIVSRPYSVKLSDDSIIYLCNIRYYNAKRINADAMWCNGDGTNDYECLQACLNLVNKDNPDFPAAWGYSRDIFLTQGKVYQTDQTLEQKGQNLKFTCVSNNRFGNQATLRMKKGSGLNLININHPSFGAENVKFKGQGRTIAQAPTYLFFNTETEGYADRDWQFNNCWFTDAFLAGKINGRGLNVINCYYGQLGGGWRIDFPNPFDPNQPSDNIYDSFRAFRFIGGRAHDCTGFLINNDGYNRRNMNSVLIEGMWIDTNMGMVNGSINQMTIDGCVTTRLNNVYIYADYISGLTIDGVTVKGINGEASTTERHSADVTSIIAMKSGSKSADGVIVRGCKFSNVYEDAFLFDCELTENIDIEGNYFADCLRANNETGGSKHCGLVKLTGKFNDINFSKNNLTQTGDWTRNTSLVIQEGVSASLQGDYIISNNNYDTSRFKLHNLTDFKSRFAQKRTKIVTGTGSGDLDVDFDEPVISAQVFCIEGSDLNKSTAVSCISSTGDVDIINEGVRLTQNWNKSGCKYLIRVDFAD